jgi:hypothetical protein
MPDQRRSRKFRNATILAVVFAALCGTVLVRFMFGGCRFGPRKSMETRARTIRAAVMNWQSSNVNKAERDCPSVDTLIVGRHLDPECAKTDTWGSPFHVLCKTDKVVVISSGPDRKFGTADDISVPHSAAESDAR